MRGQTLRLPQTIEYQTETCYRCGVSFAMESSFHENRVDDKKDFYCPNGHSQHYLGKTKDEQIREAQEKLRLQMLETSRQSSRADAAEKSASRLRKRVKHGVCPCCQRTFKQLASHMKNKHPNYKET